jgi:hypothetical protein
LYSRLRFLTSACLVGFGTVVAAGAVGVLPGLIERLSVGAVEVSPSCKDEIRLPWGRTCSSQAVAPSVAARLPGSDVQVADHPDLHQTTSITSIEPPQASQNTASATIEFMQPREALAPAQQLASAPAAVEEAPQATPTAQAPPLAPSVKPKARPVKKVARREPSSERRRDEALSTVRRFGGNTTREIPVDSYAAEGAPRRITIRPTSIQDVYYYYGRR